MQATKMNRHMLMAALVMCVPTIGTGRASHAVATRRENEGSAPDNWDNSRRKEYADSIQKRTNEAAANAERDAWNARVDARKRRRI